MGKKKSLGRAGQFLRAVKARVTAEELAFMKAHLPPEVQPLFLAMHVADQRHVLNVAYTALELAKDASGVDRELLVRCCLLHDVGRVKGTLDVWGKVWTVLANKFLPAKMRFALEKDQGGSLWQKPGYALYVHRRHPEMGAAKLESLGFEREAEIIRLHHKPEAPGDAEELKILRRADALN